MNIIPTAKDFYLTNIATDNMEYVWDVMKEFAKLHVERALVLAAKAKYSHQNLGIEMEFTPSQKKAILSSYNFDDIK